MVSGPTGPISGAKVYLMPQTTKVINVQGAVQAAYDAMHDELSQQEAGTPPWNTALGKPGVPSEGDMKSWMRVSRENITLKGPDDNADWNLIIPTLVVGAARANGESNVASLPGYFESKIVPLLKANPADMRGEGTTAGDGTVELPGISPGNYALICSAHTEKRDTIRGLCR